MSNGSNHCVVIDVAFNRPTENYHPTLQLCSFLASFSSFWSLSDKPTVHYRTRVYKEYWTYRWTERSLQINALFLLHVWRGNCLLTRLPQELYKIICQCCDFSLFCCHQVAKKSTNTGLTFSKCEFISDCPLPWSTWAWKSVLIAV